MDTKPIIEALALLSSFLGILLYFRNRESRRPDDARNRGVGVRGIQVLALFTIVPVILILGLEGVLEKASAGTLLGAISGYVLSGFGGSDGESQQQKTGSGVANFITARPPQP